MSELQMPKQIGDDVRGAYEALQRLHAKAQARGVKEDPDVCPKGCANGWIVYDKGDQVMAEPCPVHKPDEREAYEAGILDDRYFQARKEQKENEGKVKEKVVQQERDDWWKLHADRTQDAYHCDECPKTFASAQGLTLHRTHVHAKNGEAA